MKKIKKYVLYTYLKMQNDFEFYQEFNSIEEIQQEFNLKSRTEIYKAQFNITEEIEQTPKRLLKDKFIMLIDEYDESELFN